MVEMCPIVEWSGIKMVDKMADVLSQTIQNLDTGRNSNGLHEIRTEIAQHQSNVSGFLKGQPFEIRRQTGSDFKMFQDFECSVFGL